MLCGTVLGAWLVFAGAACALGYASLLAQTRPGWPRRIDWSWFGQGILAAWPLFVASLSTRGMATFDRFFLEDQAGLEVLGAYVLFMGITTAILSFLDAGVVDFSYPRLVEHAGRGEVISGADFLEVDGDGGGGFGAVDHVAGHQPLRVAEDVLADPGRRQVGQHLVFGGQLVETGADGGAVDQGAVGVHHALGVAGGARGEEHRGHVVGLRHLHLLGEQLRVDLGKRLAGAGEDLGTAIRDFRKALRDDEVHPK